MNKRTAADTPTTPAPEWRVQHSAAGGLVLSPAGLVGPRGGEPWEEVSIGPFPLGNTTIREERITKVTKRKSTVDTGLPFWKGRIARDWHGNVSVTRLRAISGGRNYHPYATCTWPAPIWAALLPDLQAIADGRNPRAYPVQWAPDESQRWFALYHVGDRDIKVPHVPRIASDSIVGTDDGGEPGTTVDPWRFVRVELDPDQKGAWRLVSFTASPLPMGRLHLQVDAVPAPFALMPDQWRDVVQADRLPALLER